MQQDPGKGSVDELEELSIHQLLDHIVALCSSMQSAFASRAAHTRPDDFLKLLDQERDALMALERRMDAALAGGGAPADLDERLDEVQQAHRCCQEVLRQRMDVTRETLQQLQALQSGHDSYREQVQ
jgi:hypothetical protein